MRKTSAGLATSMHHAPRKAKNLIMKPKSCKWWREGESNPRLGDYEPPVLPLNYPAILNF